MAISYNGLWKLLIDKNKKKTDLIDDIGISSSTLAKMSKGDAVSINILEKICEKYNCNFGDIMSYENDEKDIYLVLLWERLLISFNCLTKRL